MTQMLPDGLGQEPPWSATTRMAARSRYYFEPTSEAVAEASRGKVLIGIACLLLTAAAGYTSLVAGRPLWVAGACWRQWCSAVD